MGAPQQKLRGRRTPGFNSASRYKEAMRSFALFILVAVAGILLGNLPRSCASDPTQSACTAAQNSKKEADANNVLVCGQEHCSGKNGTKQQDCLCTSCAKDTALASKSSCACGLADPNSEQACSIYQTLNSKCIHGATARHAAPGDCRHDVVSIRRGGTLGTPRIRQTTRGICEALCRFIAVHFAPCLHPLRRLKRESHAGSAAAF